MDGVTLGATASTVPVPVPVPIPVDDDHDTGGFFEAARRHELVIRMCDGCDAVLHMPRAYCRHCGGWEGRWQPVAGTGKLYSWTVVEHQVHPSFQVPYTVVLVELDDVPAARLVGHLPGRPQLTPGQPMRVRFETVDGAAGERGPGDGLVDRRVVVPQWMPA